VDSATKRLFAEKVRRRVARQLETDGFRRTKSSFWTRPQGPAIEFVHLHLYRATASFRVHIGLRAWDDPFAAIALNGPASHPTDKYAMDFGEDESSIAHCTAAIVQYRREVGEPWWSATRSHEVLIGPQSPLNASARQALASALDGDDDREARHRTRSLLGVV
jgi:hypothetical protein